MKIAIITGASSGMGREFALQLDQLLKSTDEIWLIARSKDKMEELAEVMTNKTRVIPMDLTNAYCFEQFAQILKIAHPEIRILVNCSGLGYLGSFTDIDFERQNEMLQCNCTGLTRMTQLCIPYMCKHARLIQLASSAAFLPQPYFAVYAASKAYVYSLSMALSEELRKQKIHVTAVCPGPVSTPFFDKAEQYGKTMFIKKLIMQDPEDVVRLAIKDSYHRKRLSVCGFPMKAFYLMTNVIPDGVILRLMRIVK